MTEVPVSRRQALRLAGAALLGGPAAARAIDPPAAPVVIDAHVHVCDSRLPGGFDKSVPLPPFEKDAAASMRRLVKAVQDDARAAGVTQALGMPRLQVSDKDPLGIAATQAVAAKVKGLTIHPVGLIHPERFDRDHLERVEAVLKLGKVKALKAYLGYLHYDPACPGYRHYFRLAGKHRVPVILHCGDTYSPQAKVKYAHPLRVDELAVDYPDTRFVIAHFGNPWITDAAQVLYKNKNVWADLSAVLIGDAPAFAAMAEDGVLDRAAKRVKEGIEYSEAPERFLFGSDWPLSPMAAYREFVKQMFPEKLHAGVFGGNAKELFGL